MLYHLFNQWNIFFFQLYSRISIHWCSRFPSLSLYSPLVSLSLFLSHFLSFPFSSSLHSSSAFLAPLSPFSFYPSAPVLKLLISHSLSFLSFPPSPTACLPPVQLFPTFSDSTSIAFQRYFWKAIPVLQLFSHSLSLYLKFFIFLPLLWFLSLAHLHIHTCTNTYILAKAHGRTHRYTRMRANTNLHPYTCTHT